MDCYGFPVNAEEETDIDIEKLKEAIKAWNGKELTKQVEFMEER